LAPLAGAVEPAHAQTVVPAATPLQVRVGERLVLRAPAGVIHAEAADPSVASVTMPSPDVIVVLGIRPADTELLLVNSATVLAQALHVRPALVLASTLPGAPAATGFVDLTYIPQTQAFWADVHRPDVDASVSSSAWQYHILTGTLTLTGSSGLQTPLANFGAPAGPGTSVRTGDGWEFVASQAQSQIAYHRPLGAGSEASLAATVAGPLATLHFVHGRIGMDLAGLYGPNGLQAAGTVGSTMGPVALAYTFGPQGSGVTAQVTQKGWSFIAADGAQGVQVGIQATVAGHNHMNVWWSAQGGYGLGLTLPLGSAGTVSVNANSGTVFAASSSPDNPAAAVTNTTGFGAGQLTLTSPPPGFPSLTAPTTTRLSPTPAAGPGFADPQTPYYTQARIAIPAGPYGVVPPQGAAPSQGAPVSIPTGSAALIAHVCLHSASTKTTCDPSDPTLAVRLHVDDRAVEWAGLALPITPGPHTISIDPQDLPPFVVPLGPLSCPITAVAGSVSVCDFAFRRAGAP
jgi:hypothetical protein